MKPLHLMLAAVALTSLGACAENVSGSGSFASSSGGYADPYEGRHRAWWAEHNAELAYEHREAEREHRVFCSKYPEDLSCEGWYQPR